MPGVMSTGFCVSSNGVSSGAMHARGRVVERRDDEAFAHALIGADHAGTPPKVVNPHTVAVWERARTQRRELQAHVEQLLRRVDADRGELAKIASYVRSLPASRPVCASAAALASDAPPSAPRRASPARAHSSSAPTNPSGSDRPRCRRR